MTETAQYTNTNITQQIQHNYTNNEQTNTKTYEGGSNENLKYFLSRNSLNTEGTQ